MEKRNNSCSQRWLYNSGSTEIERYTIDKRFILEHGHGSSGRYARISFKDTGIGMDEKTMQRIFVPFFTTKEKAQVLDYRSLME